MPITLDSVSYISYPTTSLSLPLSSYQWQHTCNGQDRYLLVGVTLFSLAPANSNISSIYYNNQSLTPLCSCLSGDSTLKTELWAVPSPIQGLSDIRVDFTGSSVAPSCFLALSLKGVHQYSPVECFCSLNEYSSYEKDKTKKEENLLSVYSQPSNSWLVLLASSAKKVEILEESSLTLRAKQDSLLGECCFFTRENPTSLSTTNLQWKNILSKNSRVMCALSLRPSTGLAIRSATAVS